MRETDHPEVAILNAVLELPASQRAAYLAKACGSDPVLHQRVEELLRAHDQADDFLEAPAARDLQRTMRLELPPREKPGDKIGRYKLLQQIGEGGCGVVYMAEQEDPVRRRVALKVIKLGMDTKQVIARFEAERQALALMDHPNIAKVLDAAATETGRPYFVMELVRGVKITDFCNENNVSTEERLKLFMQVCQAIQHAHQKGIIHRDIKPSNILITVNDDVPVPKVIDFGIAKATQGRLTDQTLFTAFDQFIGTPAYMSPEQAVMTSLDVDTRSDIYSLGVLLYELLVGRTPFDQKELLAAGLDEMRRTIREKEPPKPSTRLMTMVAGELTTTAKHRRTEAPKLIHLVRGDLDWIVMKCLEKDRTRRYETANGLATDIQRHLKDEPITARPPSRLYEFQKTVRRHKFGFAAAGAVALALLAGVIASTWQAVRATRAEREQTLLRQRAEEAGRKARQQEQMAIESAQTASEQALLARRRFYAAQMNLANQAVEAEQPARALGLLETLRPKSTAEDLRGFEWYHLWGVCNSRLHLGLQDGASPVFALRFSPGDNLLASASQDGTLCLWDISGGQARLKLKMKSPATLEALAFTPDGETLVSGGWDYRVRLWNVRNGESRGTLAGHRHLVRSLAISSDGQRLASGDQLGEIRLWDLTQGKELIDTLPGKGAIMALFFSSNGATLFSGAGHVKDGLTVWDLTSNPPKPRLLGPGGWTGSLSPNEEMIAAGGWDNIGLWDITTGKLLADLKGHLPPVTALTFLPGSKSFVSCAKDRTIRLWKWDRDPAAAESQIIGVHTDGIQCLAASADGTLVASGAKDGSIRLWNMAQPPTPITGFSNVMIYGGMSRMQCTREGSDLFRFTEKGTLADSIDTQARKLVLPDASGFGALSPRTNLLATCGRDGVLKLWDYSNGKLLASTPAHRLRDGGDSVSLVFSPDGSRLVSAGGYADIDESVKVWEVTPELRTAWEGSRSNGTWTSYGSVSTVGFSPDGKTLAVAVGANGISFLDSATGRVNGIIPTEDNDILAAVFSPDGKLLACGFDTGAVRLWDIASEKLHVSLEGHTANVRAIAFSPDGGTVVTGSDDLTVRLWDTVTGQERVTFKGGDTRIQTVAFSPDGNTLAAGCVDTVVKFWHVHRTPEAAALARPPGTATGTSAANDNNIAWKLAIAPESRMRDGPRAVILAERAVAATGRTNGNYLDTLAAAYAEAGQFEKAVSAQKEAMAIATEAEKKRDRFEERLKLYQSNTPYRETK